MCALLIQHECEAALEVLPEDMEAQAKAELNKKAHSVVILYLGNKVLREDTLKLEDVLETLNTRKLQKMTEAKDDGGEGLYNHKKSQGFFRNEDQVSGSRADGYDNTDVMMAMSVKAKLDIAGYSWKKGFYREDAVSQDQGYKGFAGVAQRRLKDKQPEEKTNTDCLVKEQEKEYQTGWKIKTGNVLVIREDTTRSTYLVNRSSSSMIGFKKPTDMLGFFALYMNMGFSCGCKAEIWATKGLLDKAKGNIFGMEIVRDQTCNTLRVSQSRFYNEKFVQNLLEGHSILSLKDSLQTYMFLWILTTPWEDRSLSWVDQSQEAAKEAIWLKGLAIESGFELKIVVGIATRALLKAVPRLRIVKANPKYNFHVTTSSPIPKSPFHALRDPNWKQAMCDEYKALIDNNTWVLVPRPPNVNILRSMWLYKYKYNADESLNRYKARLVANGRSQQQGIGCDETFSLVVKHATIRTVLSLAVSREWPIHHFFYFTPTTYHLLLHAEFTMIDLGPLNYFLGPQFTEKKLRPKGSPVNDPTLYRSLVGSLQYLTFTRPDLSYAVQQLCLYMHDPREPHLNAMKRVLRYLRGTTNLELQLFRSTASQLIAHSDADWAGHVVSFSAEAKYRWVINAVAETSWIRNLLRELHTPLFTATLVYCDNVSAVYMSANPLQHQRTKHIEIDIHFVRGKVATRHVRVLHVWRFRTQDSSLWSRVISAIHGDSGHLHKLPTTSSSSTWMNIIREMFNLKHQRIDLITYITEKVGNGENSLFWDGVWTGDTALKEQYPRVYALDTCKSISNANKLAHSNVEVSLRRPPRGGVELHQYNNLSSRLDSIQLPMIQDRWVLSLDGTWEFTTTSARKLIDDKRLPKLFYYTR
nr:ribonuclease H-like domain-containing protein [Tanacetum cinerariifolium]